MKHGRTSASDIRQRGPHGPTLQLQTAAIRGSKPPEAPGRPKRPGQEPDSGAPGRREIARVSRRPPDLGKEGVDTKQVEEVEGRGGKILRFGRLGVQSWGIRSLF